MSDASKKPPREKKAPAPEAEVAAQAEVAVQAEVAAQGTAVEVSLEDGVSEASAEAQIAALVEAEREAEAEEQAIADAEAAAESEEPEEDPGEEVPTAPEAEPVAKAPARPKKPAVAAPTPSRRLAVLGSPIGHSKSPALHRAAYDALGLDWAYEQLDVAESGLGEFIAGLGPEWRGLSLTMPLKQAVLPLLTETDRVAERAGAANTVLLDGDAVRGFNTDVAGMVRALEAAGLESARYVHILGGGATAASALVAVAEVGAERVDIHVRDLAKSVWLEPLAHELGLMVRLRSFAQADRSLDVPELVVSALPGGAATAAVYTDSTRRRALLFDVAYDPWPTPLAKSWQAVGGRVVSGLALLAQQAVLQVRIFVSGDPLEPLVDEDAVLAAMLEAVGIDAAGAPIAD